MTHTKDELFLWEYIFKLGSGTYREIMTPSPYRIWVSMYGAEEAWDGQEWRKVRPGAFLVNLVQSPLKHVDDSRELFKAVSGLPAPEGAPDKTKGGIAFRIRYLLLALSCIEYLIPSRGRSKYKEGPGIAKRRLAEISVPEFHVELTGDPIEDLVRTAASRFESLPLTFWLSAAWNRSSPTLDCRGDKFGFQIQSDNIWTAALAEGLMLILFNVRRIRWCPHCNTLHWDKKHHVCKECRKRQDRQRKAGKLKTPEDRFRNKVSQAKSRKRITPQQAVRIRNVLAKDGLPSAERLYQSLREKG